MQNHEYGHATRRPYAHARASSMLPVLVEELLLLDPGKLRKLARSARREANRTRWRNRVQQRCSKISAGIAAARRALRDPSPRRGCALGPARALPQRHCLRPAVGARGLVLPAG